MWTCCCDVPVQVHCLVEHGAVLERADNGGTRDRTSGCQNPALVASLLKKASKTGKSPPETRAESYRASFSERSPLLGIHTRPKSLVVHLHHELLFFLADM